MMMQTDVFIMIKQLKYKKFKKKIIKINLNRILDKCN